MSAVIRIVYADGSRGDRELLKQFVGVAGDGFDVAEAGTLGELNAALADGDPEAVIGDLDLPGCDGIGLVGVVHNARPGLPVVVLTGDQERAVKALQQGADSCLTKTPDQLGRLPHIVRGLVEKKRLEAEKSQMEARLRMVTRARNVMAECDRVLVRATEEGELQREMCRIVVESGGYQTAWIGMVRHDAQRTIEPVARFGLHTNHLSNILISWADNESGKGPAGLAVRTRQPQAARRIQTDPYFSTQRPQVVERGFAAAAALPLMSENEVIGVLGILAGEPDAFDADELRLLDELANDIAYGLTHLRLLATQRRAEQLLRLEHTVTRCLAEGDNATQAMREVMQAVCETEGWDCGRYFRVDEPAGVLRYVEGWGVRNPGIETFLERSRAVTYAPGAGLVGRIWQSGEPLWIADLTGDNRPQRLAYTVESGIRAAFLFPVTSGGAMLGVLSFSSREIREPDERLLQAVRVIGSQIGQFLRRRQGDEELQRFRAAMDSSSDMIMLVDRATMRYIDVNTTACEMQGYSREELLRMGPHDVAGIPRAELERVYDDMIAGGHTTWRQSDHRRKDGTVVPIEIFRRAVRTDQGWIIVAMLRDVSERVRAERLQNLEHTVAHCLSRTDDTAAALRAVLQAMCETESWACGRYFRVDEAAGLLRYAEGWSIAEPVFERFVEASRDLVFRRGEGVSGRAWDIGEPLWSTDIKHDPRALRATPSSDHPTSGVFAFPVSAEGKTNGVLVFSSREPREPDDRLLRAVRAIGSQIGQFLERRRVEAVVRESEARFRSLTTLSSDWYWEQDAEYRFVDMTAEIDRRTGVSALAHIGKRRWELAAPNMTEADWARHRAVVEAHQPFHDLELCRLAEDGSLHWVVISGEPIVDTAGRFTGYRGIGKDITARKREEQLLALEHAVARRLAEAENAPAALNAVLRAVCETEDWECGRYFRVDEEAGVLRCREAWSIADPGIERFVAASREATYQPGEGLAGRIWQTAEPLWSTDAGNDTRVKLAPLASELGLRTSFMFPVTAVGRVIGVMGFSSLKVRDPEERLLRAVVSIGSQIGQFLQRKDADERVASQALQQRVLGGFGQEALASADLADVLDGAAKLIASTLKVDLSSALELDEEGGFLTYRAAVGWPEDWVGRRVVPLLPGSRLDYVISRRDPLIIDDYDAASDFVASPLTELGIRSGVQVPIFGTRRTYGVLSVHTRERRSFTTQDLTFVRNVANILAIAIERKNAEDRLAHLAQFDTITGLPNRHLLRDRLGQALTQAQRNQWVGAILFVDLDRFKAVNDTYGHGVGDQLLGQVAGRLKECVRGGDTVGRISGDEFAVLLSSVAKGDDAALVAQKIVARLAEPFTLEGHQTYISASVGIALYPADGADAETLLKNADTAMYRAKEQGRNCYQFYLPQMNERLMERLRLETRLRGALERDEFLLHYQPKVQLDTGVICGFEALLRWKQAGGLVSPAEFIPILEDTGQIVAVGEWVLRTVCEQLKSWQNLGLTPRPVAINLSSRQFQHKFLVIMVEQILRETGVAPELLELELTETLLMSDAEEAVQMLRELKGLGVRLAVDDFGTGYSSLAYLKRFPLDTLKIDRAFVRDAVSNPDDATLTVTIINLAHSMRLKVVAEGVETQAQLNFLRLHGCDEMQGFLFARPLEVAACTQALIEGRRLQNDQPVRTVGIATVLLVDDSEEDLALLERALVSDDFLILTATSPAAGFELLARQGADMVVSDLQMPSMSGVDFLAHVRKLYPHAVRVLASGADHGPPLASAVNHAGIHRFLSKNWDPERLRAEVREAYQMRRL